MGYTTDFTGEFRIDPILSINHAEYLRKFNETRRMARNADIALTLPDPIRLAVNLPIGHEGSYFVGGDAGSDRVHDSSIIDFNSAPGEERNRYSRTLSIIPANPDEGQPGLWCQWVPNEFGTAIIWDEGEKFYNYIEWLNYIIKHFLQPWQYNLNGICTWQGEDDEDKGKIYVRDNVVTHQKLDDPNDPTIFTIFTEPFDLLKGI